MLRRHVELSYCILLGCIAPTLCLPFRITECATESEKVRESESDEMRITFSLPLCPSYLWLFILRSYNLYLFSTASGVTWFRATLTLRHCKIEGTFSPPPSHLLSSHASYSRPSMSDTQPTRVRRDSNSDVKEQQESDRETKQTIKDLADAVKT